MAVPQGFQSSTRPIDTFVKQSTVAGIKYTGGLNDVATALAKIEPALNKFIVNKIKEIKEEEVAEAQTEGEEAARKYTKTQRLLFPEGVEIDESSSDFATTIDQLRGKVNENDRKIYQGKSIWYKNAFEEAKAIRLGKTYATEMLNDYDTYRVKDPRTGIEKPLSAYPFTSSIVQDFISTYRNKNVELAAISPFHFQRSFLPEIKDGTKQFLKKHETDHAAYKLNAHKKETTGGLETVLKSWEAKRKENPTAKFGDLDFAKEKETIKFLVENAGKLYQGKDLSDFYKDVFIPFVNETAVSIAGNKALGENRFALAMQWIEEVPQLFPRELATKTVINKDGSVSLENIPEPVFLKDENSGELVIDEASGNPIQKYEVVENADGTKSTIPVVTFKLSDKTVLESKQNYLKERNIAIKKINGLQKDYIQFGKEAELAKGKARMKEILTNAAERELEDGEKQELNEIIATSSKARTWLENNRNTYRNRTYDGGLHLRDAINNGQYRERNVAEAAIKQWWSNSLQLPADLKLYNEMIGDLDTEIDEERLYAIKYASGKTSDLNKLVSDIATESGQGIQIIDTTEQYVADYEKDVKMYSITKHNFGDVDKDNQPVKRYPTILEIEDYADNKFITLKDKLTSTLAALSDQQVDFNPLSEVNLALTKKVERRSLARHIARILNNPPIQNNGERLPITLDFIIDSYDIKEIDKEYFFDQFKNSKGEYDVNSTQLEKILSIVELTNEEISTYGLIDVLSNSAKLENQARAKEYQPFKEGGRGFSLPDDYTETEKQVFDGLEEKQQVVTPSKVDENIQKSNVSDKTTDETQVIEGGSNNDESDSEVVNPRNSKLSKIFAIPEGATDGSLLAAGEVPYPIGAGKNFGQRFDLYLEEYYGFDQQSRIWKKMPNYVKVNLMEDFRAEAKEGVEELEAELEENKPVQTTGDFMQSQDLSEVKSDMTPNLGLRDGSLLAMALPFKGKETKEQEDTQVTISKEPNAIQRMETNFKTIYALAKEVGIKFPEVIAAQFGAESDHGLLVTGKNNYFGIKATQAEIDAGQSTLAPTFEEIDGKKVRVMAHFKNFDSIRESIEHYKKFWNDDFQDRKGLINVNTAEEAIIRLKENGYATDSDYVKLVTDVLNDARREPPLF